MDSDYHEHHGSAAIAARVDQIQAGIREHGFIVNCSYPENGGPIGVAYTVGRHLNGRPELVASGPFDGPTFRQLLSDLVSLDDMSGIDPAIAQEVCLMDPQLPQDLWNVLLLPVVMRDNDPLVWVRETYPDQNVRLLQALWRSDEDQYFMEVSP